MASSTRVRVERFGAMLRTEDPPALVSVDRVLARRLGVEGRELWAEPSRGAREPWTAPAEVHLALTERCAQGCPGCYADATPTGREASPSALGARLETLASMGAFSVTFGGGEASLHPDLFELARRARALGLIPSLTTSGAGVREDNAADFRVFAQVNVSYDATPSGSLVRSPGTDELARRAMDRLANADVPFGVNFVLTRQGYPELERVAAFAAQRGAVELQLLRLIPGGRGRARWEQGRLTAAQIAELGPRLARLSSRAALRVRINCALLPLLADAGLDAAGLSRFGVFGCEAGRALMTVDIDGRVSPCSYQHVGGRALGDEPWTRDEGLARHRSFVDDLPEPCASCDLAAACRGGCRVVASHATGRFEGLDPECPRVAQAAKESTAPEETSTR